MKDGKCGLGTRLAIVAGLVVLVAIPACRIVRGKRGGPRDQSLVLVTGYCNCGQCCGWDYDESGETAQYTYGPMKGRPKIVGRTASGTTAGPGTIAADPKMFKFGTKLFVPGYGTGTVEDVGGSIKGRHIDIWFPEHQEAQRWGARWLKVKPVLD